MKRKNRLLKKVISIFTVFALVLTMMPVISFATVPAGNVATSVSHKVTITSQANQKFLHEPLLDKSIDSNLAEKYGYDDKIDSTKGVSVLDALVRAHVAKYGGEFTNNIAKQMLDLDEVGNVNCYFGEKTTLSGVLINGQLSDKPVNTVEIKDGDKLEFFRYASEQKDDIYAGVSNFYYTSGLHWKPVSSINKVSGKDYFLYCFGYNVSKFGVLADADRIRNAECIADIQISQINLSTGGTTPVPGAISEGSNTKASVSISQKTGAYYLTAIHPSKNIIIPFIEVNIIDEPQLKVLELYKNTDDFNARINALKMTPALKDGLFTYSVDLMDYEKANGVLVYSSFSTNSNDPTDTYNGEKLTKMCSNSYGGWSGGNSAFVKDGFFNVYYMGDVGKVADYKIKPNTTVTLKNLQIEGVVDKKFDPLTKTYRSYVAESADKTIITATGYSRGYTITIDGKEAVNGEAYTQTLNWNKDGKAEIDIVVSSSDCISNTYHVVYEKEPKTDIPTALIHPESSEYVEGSRAVEMKAKASANGTIEYQWYKNDKPTTEGATLIEKAVGESYIPSTNQVGETYYFCRFTNKTNGKSTDSNFAKILVEANPTPIVEFSSLGNPLGDEYAYQWKTGFVYDVGKKATALTAVVKNPIEGAKYTYTWMRAPGNKFGSAATVGIPKARTQSFIPPTSVKDANNEGYFWRCQVTCNYKGKKYTGYTKTGEKNSLGKDVTGVYVFVKVANASTPRISAQPKDMKVSVGDANRPTLNVRAISGDSGKLSYQWYVNNTNSKVGAQKVEGATQGSYPIPTDKEGTLYYYCVITNTLQGKTAQVESSIGKVEVVDAQSLAKSKLEKAGIKGDGSEKNPYEISTVEQLLVMQELVNKDAYSFENQHLSLVTDITLPQGWKPMGVTKDGREDLQGGANLNAFSGNLDGKSHKITVPENGLPLLGYVKNAEVRNLKIYGKKIEGYGLVNNFEGVGLSGSAIIIDNVTLLSGTSTKKAGLIGTNITTNGFAGCSAGFEATIRNCVAEKGVVIGYDGKESNIGTFAGRMQGLIENCISHAEVKGKDYVGGIIGSRDNAMGMCEVKNCTFDGIVTASGEQVGGIIGGAYINTTAPNGVRVFVEGNKCSGTISGKNKVGGILGADQFINQNWGTGTFKMNEFTGKVTATDTSAEKTYIGGVIGYLSSLNKFDNIAGNYYAKNCGAEKGIGFVKYVDTSCKNHETASGATYVNTSIELPEASGFTRKNHNRTDDPLGKDAVRLTYSDDQKDPIMIDLQISGKYKTEYLVGEEFDFTGMILTAQYHNGITKVLQPKDVKVDGFDSTKRGNQKVSITYEGVSTVINVSVMKPAGKDITVKVEILGDVAHGDAGEKHTLAGNNLKQWMASKEVTIGNNDTVWEALNKAIKGTNIKVSNPSGNYIDSVTYNGVTLGEFTNGKNSGWMYTLNGKHPLLGVSEQFLDDGDEIVLHYTDDYTKEEGSEDWGPGGEEKPPVVDPNPDQGGSDKPPVVDPDTGNKPGENTGDKPADKPADKPSAKPDADKKPGSPQTGDENEMLLLGIALLASAGVFTAVARKRKTIK